MNYCHINILLTTTTIVIRIGSLLEENRELLLSKTQRKTLYYNKLPWVLKPILHTIKAKDGSQLTTCVAANIQRRCKDALILTPLEIDLL